MTRAGSDDAPLDFGRNAATGEKASSDAPVDLEKGAAGAKAATEEEEEEMDPRLAMCIKVSLDVAAVVFVFYYIGMIAWMVRHSDNPSDTCTAVLLMTPTLVFLLWLAPKMKYDTNLPSLHEKAATAISRVKTTLLPSKK